MLPGFSLKRDLRLEATLLPPGRGLCLACQWRPDPSTGVPVDEQCQVHTDESAHPTTFRRLHQFTHPD